MKAAASKEKKNSIENLMFLPVLAICVDLFTPYLIWNNKLPSIIRWLSDFALAAMLLITIFRMFAFNRIPYAFWMIAFISIFWSFVAIGHGQGITPTIWGVWLLIQFPFAALFIYLQPELPQHFPEYLRKFCLSILGVELFAQLLQYASGVTPGDSLSGLFGGNGTGIAVIFDLLICCVFFGHWIANKKWGGLVASLIMSMLSSVLGEMKLFAIAIVVIGLVAIFLYALKYRAPGEMLIYLTLMIIILVAFTNIYNLVVPGASTDPLQTYITNPTRLLDYLSNTISYNDTGGLYTDIGRGAAVNIGWQSIQKDPITFLFGYGLGTRSESQSLGAAGVALTTGTLGLSVGTSLLVFMQEIGITGLAVLGAFVIWILLALAHDIRTHPESSWVGFRYALILFTIMCPVWLFYAVVWTMRVPMLLYWFCVGCSFAEGRILPVQRKKRSRRKIVVGAQNA